MNAELSMLQVMGDYGHTPHGAYRAQQVLTAGRENLVLMVYDHVISSCRARDKKRASAGMATLIDSLDLDQGEIALGLFRLYRYAMNRVWEGRFDDALSVMRPLRDTWAAAVKGRASSQTPALGNVLAVPERAGASIGR